MAQKQTIVLIGCVSGTVTVELPPSGTVEETKVSQREIKFIAEFLDKFDSDEEIEYNEEGIDVRVAAARGAASDDSDVDLVTHR